ncbi:hypothetical protein [Halobaculum gomorrense]|uniref:Uncharacterized protein n=1 Tax=Halobaculum gomorrense TaxID=43928 RepID=A0A1M5P2Y8_9EURY|nr:hypothetical protein [Halobaculum gomorrense]SHG96171.1 hypothetical protein SAMN05443636_1441 [Halobaculum gomorrense]
MRPDDLPVVRTVLRTGADDRGYDALLLAGPVVLALVAVLGRGPSTTALAAGYIAAFAGRTAVNALW